MREIREPFHVRLLRGDARGAGPAVLRLLLTPPSWLFATLAELRRALFVAGVCTRHRVPCPVISVGNLTVGGTGKSPLVEWVVREVLLLGLQPAVVSRGYGAPQGEVPDETAVLSENLPEIRQVRDPDRVRGALAAIERHLAQAIVLDDGFQHLRLFRQLDLVAVDATFPFGGGHCLPRGMLREPVRALRHADGIVVTRADQVPPAALDRTLARLRRASRRVTLATARHEPTGLYEVGGNEEREGAWLAGRRVLAVSGIGNPAAFERTLEDLGAKVEGRLRYPDHHRYSPEDLAGIRSRAGALGVEAVVTTQKDAVKWPGSPSGGPPSFALHIRLTMLTGREEIRTLVRGALRGTSH